MNKIENYKLENTPGKVGDVRKVLEDMSETYLEIRSGLMLLESYGPMVAGHIKSHEGYEYFLDTFQDTDECLDYKKFNTVRVFGQMVELLYEPVFGSMFDKNNISFGICSLDDIENIDEVIRKRKEHYKAIEQEKQ